MWSNYSNLYHFVGDIITCLLILTLLTISKLLYQWYNKLFISLHLINGKIKFQNFSGGFNNFRSIFLLLLEKKMLFYINFTGTAIVNS